MNIRLMPLATLLVFVALPCPASSDRLPTLPEVIAVTQANHPLAKAADESIAAIEARLDATDWIWVPRMSAKGYGSMTPSKWGNPIIGGTDYDEWAPYLSFEFDAILPLYTFGKISALKDMAKSGIDVARAQKQVVSGQLELQVVRAWLGLQLASSLEDILGEGEQYLKRARTHLETLRDQDSKDYDDVDLLRLKVVESDVGSRKLELQRLRRISLAGLVQLSGLPPESFSSPGKLRRFSFDRQPLETYSDLAMANRGELRAVDAAIAVQDARVDYETRRFFPDFFVGGFYKMAKAWAVEGQGSPFAYDPYNSWFAGAGLGFEWKFDLVDRLGTFDEQSANLRAITFQGQALRGKVLFEVEDAYSSVIQWEETIRLAETAFKAARGWTIAKVDLYESGMAELTDLTDALKEFFVRKLALETATLEYNLAVARLANSCGISVLTLVSFE